MTIEKTIRHAQTLEDFFTRVEKGMKIGSNEFYEFLPLTRTKYHLNSSQSDHILRVANRVQSAQELLTLVQHAYMDSQPRNAANTALYFDNFGSTFIGEYKGESPLGVTFDPLAVGFYTTADPRIYEYAYGSIILGLPNEPVATGVHSSALLDERLPLIALSLHQAKKIDHEFRILTYRINVADLTAACGHDFARLQAEQADHLEPLRASAQMEIERAYIGTPRKYDLIFDQLIRHTAVPDVSEAAIVEELQRVIGGVKESDKISRKGAKLRIKAYRDLKRDLDLPLQSQSGADLMIKDACNLLRNKETFRYLGRCDQVVQYVQDYFHHWEQRETISPREVAYALALAPPSELLPLLKNISQYQQPVN